MQKLGLKLWSINTEHYLAEARRLYEEGWCDYVELYVVPGNREALPLWKELRAPYIIHCPHFAHGFNLAKPEKRADNRRIYAEVKQYADALDAPYIIFHGGVDGSAEVTASQLAALQEPRALIENKPLLALPSKMHGRFCRGFSPEEISLIQQVAQCGFCLDIGHAVCSANSQQKEPYGYLEEFLSLRPQMVHLSGIDDMSSEYDAHPHLRGSRLDLARIFRMLPQACLVTLETNKSSPTKLDDFKDDVRICRAQAFRLRRACESDAEAVFQLRNEAGVRRNSLCRNPLAWEEHAAWFAERVQREGEPFFIIESAGGEFLGQVRFDPQGEAWLVSASLREEWRGMGLGSAAICRAVQAAGAKRVVAMVRVENVASARAFSKAGFVCAGREGELARYTYTA